MSKKDSTLTAERLRELVVYRDGELFWRHPTGRMKRTALGCPAGKEAAMPGRTARLQVFIEGRMQYAHRLVWLYHHGEWPDGQIDHINGCNQDNRIENLRVLSNAENVRNRQHRGVSLDKRNGRWRARLMVDGRSHSLGYFDTEREAMEAYETAKQRLHKSYATGVGRNDEDRDAHR